MRKRTSLSLAAAPHRKQFDIDRYFDRLQINGPFRTLIAFASLTKAVSTAMWIGVVHSRE